MLFQDPATSNMEGIVDLHADICCFQIVVLIQVLWVGARIVVVFHHSHQPTAERFNHHTRLEVVWAVQPSVIVTLIRQPSQSLVYTFDDLVTKPCQTVKITGRQWYWSYAIDEHVNMNQSANAQAEQLKVSIFSPKAKWSNGEDASLQNLRQQFNSAFCLFLEISFIFSAQKKSFPVMNLFMFSSVKKIRW